VRQVGFGEAFGPNRTALSQAAHAKATTLGWRRRHPKSELRRRWRETGQPARLWPGGKVRHATGFRHHRLRTEASARQRATQKRAGTGNRPAEPNSKPSGNGGGEGGCGTRTSWTRFCSTREPVGQLAGPQANKERNCPGRLGGRDNWLSGPAGAPQPLGRGAPRADGKHSS
jgi:hypothetical protein